MENQLQEIYDLATKLAAHNTETRTELEIILKKTEDVQLRMIGNCIFTVNEHEIIEGIGFRWNGDLKVWNNTKFGTFKKDDHETDVEREFMFMDIEKAKKVCEDTNREYRIVSIDGASKAITFDCVFERVNFYVEKGIIVKVNKG